MRSLSLVCLLLLIFNSEAEPSGVSYSLSKSLADLLSKNGFSRVGGEAPKFIKKMDLDEGFEKGGLKSAVFVKWGVPKRKKRFTIRKVFGGTEVYIFKTTYSLALFFHNVETPFREEVTTLLKQLPRSVSSTEENQKSDLGSRGKCLETILSQEVTRDEHSSSFSWEPLTLALQAFQNQCS